MADELISQLETFTENISDEMARDLREEVVANLEEAEQGADGLVDFVEDVERRGDSYAFRIAHPTAALHEKGGHIEPTYSRAKAVGWTRDGFYAALEDCEEHVTKKRPVDRAMITIRRRYEDEP